MFTNKDLKFYIIFIVTTTLMFGFGYLSPFGEISPQGMKILGIFLGLIVSWCFGEIIWSSFLGLIALALMGFGTMGTNHTSLFGNINTGMLLFAMLIVYALQTSGVMSEFAKWITGAKWARKGAWPLVAAFFSAALILTIFVTSGLPVILMLWALFYEVCRELDIKQHDPYASIVLVGIAIISTAGSVVMPYAPSTLMCLSIEKTFTSDLAVNNLSYLALNLTIAVLITVACYVVARYILRPPINFKMKETEPYKMRLSLKGKISLVYVGILVAFLLLPPLLPEGVFFKMVLNNRLSTLGVLTLITVMMAVTHIEGKPLLDIQDGLKNGVQWPLFILASTALTASAYLVDPSTGILTTLTSFVTPILGGKSALFVLVVSVGGLVIMTNFINDIVSLTIMYPLCLPFFVEAGGSATLLAVLMIPAMMQGCFMPSGSMIGALLHGNSEWLSAKENYMYIGIMEIVVLFVICAVGVVCHNFNIIL